MRSRVRYRLASPPRGFSSSSRRRTDQDIQVRVRELDTRDVVDLDLHPAVRVGDPVRTRVEHGLKRSIPEEKATLVPGDGAMVESGVRIS